jgi:hypothetical protein
MGVLQIPELDSDSRWMRALDGSEYMPGLVGLNNMSRNDYVNVIIQAGSMAATHQHFRSQLFEERDREQIGLLDSCTFFSRIPHLKGNSGQRRDSASLPSRCDALP